MPLDQSSRDIQPKPCAFAYRLGGEKWIKDAITNLGRNARAIVDNPDYHSVALAIRDQIHAAALTHGVQRIVEQVRPHLIEFTAKSIHRWKVLLDVHAEAHRLALRFRSQHNERVGQSLRDVNRL